MQIGVSGATGPAERSGRSPGLGRVRGRRRVAVAYRAMEIREHAARATGGSGHRGRRQRRRRRPTSLSSPPRGTQPWPPRRRVAASAGQGGHIHGQCPGQGRLRVRAPGSAAVCASVQAVVPRFEVAAGFHHVPAKGSRATCPSRSRATCSSAGTTGNDAPRGHLRDRAQDPQHASPRRRRAVQTPRPSRRSPPCRRATCVTRPGPRSSSPASTRSEPAPGGPVPPALGGGDVGSECQVPPTPERVGVHLRLPHGPP